MLREGRPVQIVINAFREADIWGQWSAPGGKSRFTHQPGLSPTRRIRQLGDQTLLHTGCGTTTPAARSGAGSRRACSQGWRKPRPGQAGGERGEPVERIEVDHAQRMADLAAGVLDAVEGDVEQYRTSWSCYPNGRLAASMLTWGDALRKRPGRTQTVQKLDGMSGTATGRSTVRESS